MQTHRRTPGRTPEARKENNNFLPHHDNATDFCFCMSFVSIEANTSPSDAMSVICIDILSIDIRAVDMTAFNALYSPRHR